MSRLISEILNASEPQFTRNLNDWEHLSGNQSHDLRLVSHAKSLNSQLVEALSLDAQDTNAKELYYALKHRVLSDNKKLQYHLKLNDQSDPLDVLKAVVELVESIDFPKDVWVIKQSVLKQLIKKNPPKKLMKILKVRSIDSALKRVNTSEIFALAREVESDEWRAKTYNSFKKLRPSDFQTTKAEIITLSEGIHKKLHSVDFQSPRIITSLYEVGVVFIIPPNSRYPGDVLSFTISLLQALADLRTYSAHSRHISTRSDFGLRFYQAIQEGLPVVHVKSGAINWSILQKHIATSTDAFERISQPHLEMDDVNTPHPLIIFAKILPEFNFWQEYELAFTRAVDRPVSSHLLDVIVNTANELDYEQGNYSYLQNSLWEELCLRYLKNSAIESEAIDQLNTN